MQSWAHLLGATLVTVTPACLMHDVDATPEAPVDLPASSEEAPTEPWWHQLDDPELSKLIEVALRDNFGLRRAQAVVAQTEWRHKAALAGLFPTVGFEASAGRSQSAPRVLNIGGNRQEVPGVAANNFSASLPVSYELDVWGRIRAGALAAEQDTYAARAAADAVALSVAAAVTERWLDVLEQRATTQLLQAQRRDNESSLAIVKLRYEAGDTAPADVLQQEQQLELIDADVALATGRRHVAEQALSALTGRSAHTARTLKRTNLPSLRRLPTRGVSASAVLQRPDVAAARHMLVAADYRVAEAIGNRLPRLVLSGSLGFGAVDLARLFEGLVWNIVGSATAAIWDGGRLDAEIGLSKAIVEERVAAYGEVLVQAMVEVEGALVQERAERNVVTTLTAQTELARRTFRSAAERYRAGVGDYLSVLTAQRSLQEADRALLVARRRVISQRVQLFRALGGPYAASLRADDADNP